MPPRRASFRARVTQVRHPCREHFQLALGAPGFPDASPGQFLQVLCHEPDDDARADAPLLRRPFSIAGLRATDDGAEISLLGRVVGPGTRWLSARAEGDVVDVLGPLGRAFSLPDKNATALLVAGGVGLPPIRWFGEILAKNQRNTLAFYGARSRDLLPVTLRDTPRSDGALTRCIEEFACVGIKACITTDDGSCGLRGTVAEALERHLARLAPQDAVCVYACGPEPLLRAIAAICAARAIPCEVALERVMGCGMGTCQSCIVPVQDVRQPRKQRYALCCSDGPVFDAAAVVWD